MSRKVYQIIRVRLPSPTRIEETKHLDDMTEERHFLYDKEKRDAISAANVKIRAEVKKLCANFVGLLVAKPANIERIAKMVSEASARLKAIDAALDAKLCTIAVDIGDKTKGEEYEAMAQALEGQMLGEFLERLEAVAQKEKVPEASRLALLRLCDAMKEWNVLDDQDIDEKIEKYRLQFEHGVIKPVLADIKKEFASLKSEGAYVDL
jgi:hypothetical protein